MEQIKRKKIMIATAMVIFIAVFEMLILFVFPPQKLKLNGGLGAIAKQKPISGLSPQEGKIH